MNNSNNNMASSFETIFKKHKTIILILPVLLLVLVLGLYFTSSSKEDATIANGNNVDTSIPSSDMKELSDSKTDVASDYEIMNDEKNKKANEQEAIELNDSNLSNSYQQPDDEVVQKVDKMMIEMDRKAKRKQTVNNSNYVAAVPVRKSRGVPVDVSYEEAPTKNSSTSDKFNDFFSSGTNTKGSTVKQSNDSFIYAVIKGDQMIKNRDRVTLMLTKNSNINDKLFLKNTVFFAIATFENDRVNLAITNLNQIQVNLKAYDAEDGGIGLHVTQSLLAESGGEAAGDATDEVDLAGVPLGNTIKRIIRRKQQIPKISLLNNQKIIFKNI